MGRFATTAACAAAAGLVAWSASGAAHAQIWIGQMAGQIAAQEAAAAQERACLAGAPASPGAVQKAKDRADALMSAYFALSSTSKPADLARVFAMKAKDVTWKGLDGAVPVTDLGARLDEPTPTLTPVSFIVGGDAMSARGVWTATPAQAGAPGLIYAVDFESQPNALLGFSWRIWHMAVFTADDPPATPGAYCHYDPDQAW